MIRSRAPTHWHPWRDKQLDRFNSWMFRHAGKLLLAFLASTCVAFWAAQKLELRSDFSELLPENYASVKDLKRVLERVGGIGTLYVTVESGNLTASKRFADALDGQIKLELSDQVNFVDFNLSSLEKFFKGREFFFLPLEDLRKVRDYVVQKKAESKKKANPLFIDLDTEAPPAQPAVSQGEIDALVDKHKNDLAVLKHTDEGYYVGENGRLLLLAVKPKGSSLGVAASKVLVNRMEELIRRMKPASFHPDMQVNLAGNVKVTVDEFEMIRHDIVSTALLCLALVALSIYLYYWRLRMVALLGLNIVAAVTWTFAATWCFIGYLTTQTAFMGSIIVGVGINYGLIYMARYLEERKRGRDVLKSMQISARTTISGTFNAAATTALSFGALIFASCRGYSQFGLIGGVGMLFCWVATFVLLPVLLAFSERLIPVVKAEAQMNERAWFFDAATPLLLRHAGKILWGGAALTLASVALTALWIPDAMDTNLARLRNRSSKKSVAGQMNDRISAALGTNIIPLVVLTSSAAETREVCDVVDHVAKKKTDKIDFCRSIFSFVPADQAGKSVLLAEIQSLLDDKTLDRLKGTLKDAAGRLRAAESFAPFDIGDLPLEITRYFTEKDGHFDRLAVIYPKRGPWVFEMREFAPYVDAVRDLKLSNGATLSASGESMIFVDMLRAIKIDGPKTTVLAFFSILILLAFSFSVGRALWIVFGALCLGVLWMVGGMAIFDLKLNFFNFIVFPTMFGTGVDYAVNLYQRYRLDGPGSLDRVLRTTGGAVVLCSITTIIGYFTLVVSQNGALHTLGQVSILGEFTCLAAAVVGMPAALHVLERRGVKL